MKIFVLLSRVPYPLDKGDKLRAFNQIKRLAKNHQLILFALNDGKKANQKIIDELNKYCLDIHIHYLNRWSILMNLFKSIFSKMPFQVAYFYDQAAKKKIDALIAKHQPNHIYCQLIRTAEYVKEVNSIEKTLDYMDAFSKGIERRVSTASVFLKPLLKIESKRLRQYESNIFNHFKNKVIISKQDREHISHESRQEIVVVPNGVDTKYFQPIQYKKDFDILFTGNMNYPPNVTSAIFLAKEILPLVQKKIPGAKLLIAGTNPARSVLALKSKTISVSGWIDDIRIAYAQSKVFVAPMKIGTGLQNKLLEAMAMKIPCVTSALANNALGGINGKNILIGSSARDYSKHIILLLNNITEANLIAQNGHDFVKANFNWDTTTEKLEHLISGAN